MTKEIAYQGYNVTPSDYECGDGQMAASLNLIHEDGALRAIPQPKKVFRIMTKGNPNVASTEYEFIFIHKTSDGETHYVFYQGSSSALYWIDSENTAGDVSEASLMPLTRGGEFPRSYTITNINAIGNTLIACGSEGMHYFLWKGTESTYKYLGTHLPELPLSFGLKGTLAMDDYFKITSFFTNPSLIGQPNNTQAQIRESYVDTVTDAILAKVNKFIADKATNAGKFIFPFFVRYAYRLYDGTLTMHSSPVLMVTDTDVAPYVFFSYDPFSQEPSVICRTEGLVFDLDYICLDENAKNKLQEWKDIVQSVDVFISAPMYYYDQSGKVEMIEKMQGNTLGRTISKVIYPGVLPWSQATYNANYADQPVIPTTAQVTKFVLPHHSEESFNEAICDNANFYFLKSINLDDIAVYSATPSDDDRVVIPVAEDYLPSLTSREVMTDDYDSHDKLMPRCMYAYNSRMNIANIAKELATPNPLASYVAYQTGQTTKKIYVFIRRDGREYVIESAASLIGGFVPYSYFYYPDNSAYKVVYEYIPDMTVTHEYVEAKLKPHDMLNGAYFFFDGFESEGVRMMLPTRPNVTSNNIVEMPNKLYTSEVNNPFLFPVTGITTVGSGEIIGLSSAVKALSQGQFGQFPMYAFATDGVWAMEVSSTGAFSARQPITQDVCINTLSITQLDDSVLFATDRGIMLIQGSTAVCITDTINTEYPFDVTELPGVSQLMQEYMMITDDTCLPTRPFRDFLLDCRMLYDYTHQHIIVFCPSTKIVSSERVPKYTYAYVYSLKSKEWGMMYSQMHHTVNSYPDAMAVLHDKSVVSMDGVNSDEKYNVLFVTRPMKLGVGDVLKSVHTVSQRGMFERGDVTTVLYGSRDLFNWVLIGSSKDHNLRCLLRGTPYKYFRVAGTAHLPNGKSLFGATVEMTARYTDKVR